MERRLSREASYVQSGDFVERRSPHEFEADNLWRVMQHVRYETGSVSTHDI